MKENFWQKVWSIIKYHHWDEHFLGGAVSSLNIWRTALILLIFQIAMVKYYIFTPPAWVIFILLLVVDTFAVNCIYDGWEINQMLCYMLPKLRKLSKPYSLKNCWEIYKMWWNEKIKDTIGDYIANNLGRIFGLAVQAVFIYIVATILQIKG